MKDIYQGLEELRFLGVFHKNLSPSIIYVSKFSLKIGGYEFCEENNHKKMAPVDYRWFLGAINALENVAPEIIFNKVPTLKTPLYSYGVIIYRLFHHGRYPLKSKSLDKLKDRYNNRDYEIEIDKSVSTVRGRAQIKPVLYGLLRVSVKERMSFVDLREFIALIHKDLKAKEEEIRYKFLNTRSSRNEKPLAKRRKKRLGASKSVAVLGKMGSKTYSAMGLDPETHKFKKNLSVFGEDFMNKSMKLLDSFKKRDNLNDPH